MSFLLGPVKFYKIDIRPMEAGHILHPTIGHSLTLRAALVDPIALIRILRQADLGLTVNC